MKRSILLLLALFVTAAPVWAADPTATKAVKGEFNGVTTLLVTVTGEGVYAVTISGAAIDDIRAPQGWVGVASGNHVMFMTDDKPIAGGNPVAFKLLTTEPSAALKLQFKGKEDPVGAPVSI